MTDVERLHRKLNRQCADLAVSFTHGHAHGPGLYVQMLRSLGAASRDPGSDGEGGSTNAPGSRPPGWRVDVSGWLADVRTQTAAWSKTATSHVPLRVLRNLPDTAADDELPDLVNVLGRWSSQAQIVLGYRVPSRELPATVCQKRVLTRRGWKLVGCRATMLRAPGVIERDADVSVWCSNPLCHDSENYPECWQAPDGTWSCRTSDHDLTHKIMWAADEFAGLYLSQQSA